MVFKTNKKTKTKKRFFNNYFDTPFSWAHLRLPVPDPAVYVVCVYVYVDVCAYVFMRYVYALISRVYIYIYMTVFKERKRACTGRRELER